MFITVASDEGQAKRRISALVMSSKAGTIAADAAPDARDNDVSGTVFRKRLEVGLRAGTGNGPAPIP
jgi:hypothetical protein